MAASMLHGMQLMLLFTTVLQAHGQQAARKLLQPESLSVSDIRRSFSDVMSQPFQAIKDAEAANIQETQRLYDQANGVSAIAYLLFGAAGPLSMAKGSSDALLPYLTPPALRIYASQPGLCSSSLMAQLYALAQRLYGTPVLQACHYDLYKALRATFGWVAGNIPLRLQQVPDQPAAAAAWPDRAAISDVDLAAAVSKALLTRAELAEAAALLSSGRCGLGVSAFAALVPSISSALRQLHADLPELQTLSDNRMVAIASREARRMGQDSSGQDAEISLRRRRAARALAVGAGGPAGPQFEGVNAGSSRQQDIGRGGVDGPGAAQDGDERTRLEVARRVLQSQQALSPNFVYSMPPADFEVQPPSAMPKLLIGLVFHVMQYRDVGGLGPPGVSRAPAYVKRMVRIANHMSRPMNISFFVKEVRSDAAAHPYLLMRSRKSWLSLVDAYCVSRTCIDKSDLVPTTIVDFPRSINIYVASDASFTRGVVGYTHNPGSEFFPLQGFVVITWDQLSVDGANSLVGYNDGVTTLVHESFHFLGLHHPFWDARPDARCTEQDADYVSDTPIVNGALSLIRLPLSAADYCMGIFWGLYGGDWEETYSRWSSNLGIPDLDKNVWADSCPGLPGFDELGNFMGYNSPVCFAALGHFTAGQAQYAHYKTSVYNPVLYSWAQYYAAQAEPPPPQVSPPPEVVNNTCRMTRQGCPCKSVWRFNKQEYSFCDRTGGFNRLTCEVADPANCKDCASELLTEQCILECDGTSQMCKKPPAPGVGLPPPPPPLPPLTPPMPPPPPPRTVQKACMVSANNCTCRDTWVFNYTEGSFCSPYKRSTQSLWCVVTPSCPDFMSSPLQPCARGLGEVFCSGSVNAQPPRPTPPTPPAPPPPRPPLSSPPPRIALPPRKPRRPK